MSGWDAWSESWIPAEGALLPLATKAEDAEIVGILAAHHEWTDSLVADFEKQLKTIIEAATIQLEAYLSTALAVTDGSIEATAANDAVLRALSAKYEQFLNESGYGDLLKKFTGRFGAQLPYLQDTLNYLNDQVQRPRDTVKFTAADLRLLDRVEATTVMKLESVVHAAAIAASERALFSIAGLPFKDLVSVIAEQTGRSIPAAAGWADTAVTMWYRTATDRAFRVIEADLPEHRQRYEYAGPLDQVTREFCRHLLGSSKVFTREEIDAMDNGQIPNVWISGGGFRCRHMWLLSLSTVN